MIRILVLHYSQTGQLTRVLDAMLAPLESRPDVRIDRHRIVPIRAYPFPWPFLSFFDAFPESVHLDAPAVDVPGLDADADYDLVILGYQVWFLSPSLPTTGFLASPHARVLAGRRVITVVGCRNMWTTAHRTMVLLLRQRGASLVDNIVLTDDGPLWSTFVTTPWWLLTGHQGPLLGVLPRAGIDEAAIAACARFGMALGQAEPAIAAGEPGPFLSGLRAVRVARLTMLAERIGHRSFLVWGRLVRLGGRPGSIARKPILVVYVMFLVAIILTVLPLTMSITALVARFSRRARAEASALEAPSGSGSERMSIRS